MSSRKWVGRMYGRLPLNIQEQNLKEILEKLQISYRTHEVFPFGDRSLVVDSYFPTLGLVIECWMSTKRHGTALTWLERSAAFVDVKFSRIKQPDAGMRCLGLVEAPRVELSSLQLVVGALMVHADYMAYSISDAERILRALEDEGRR